MNYGIPFVKVIDEVEDMIECGWAKQIGIGEDSNGD